MTLIGVPMFDEVALSGHKCCCKANKGLISPGVLSQDLGDRASKGGPEDVMHFKC